MLIRVRAETLEGYVGTSHAFTLPRLLGKQQQRIDYHHLIWSLVRKPGAFAAYRYREELFPTTLFRKAYDRLVKATLAKADREYVRVLHLAASTAKSEVETALSLLLEANTVPTAVAVRELVGIAYRSRSQLFRLPRSIWECMIGYCHRGRPMPNTTSHRHDDLAALLGRLKSQAWRRSLTM